MFGHMRLYYSSLSTKFEPTLVPTRDTLVCPPLPKPDVYVPGTLIVAHRGCGRGDSRLVSPPRKRYLGTVTSP